MAMVTIPLTKEQKETIKAQTGMTLEFLTIEKIVEKPAKIDLTVTEIEDRLNAAIEVPAPQRRQISTEPGNTLYVCVSPEESGVVHVVPQEGEKGPSAK